MSTTVKMPLLGESIIEGTVARWLKAPGDAVTRLEPLLEVSTDKIDTEVPAPVDGLLLRILVPEGETVDIGTILAYIGEAGEALPTDAPETVSGTASAPTSKERIADQPANPAAEEPQSIRARSKPFGREFVSPVVARIAAEHQIDVAAITGTGLGGRVTKKDILAYIQMRASQEPTAPKGKPPLPKASLEISGRSAVEDEYEGILTPLTTMRRAIAQHMVQSKATSAHVTTVFEADMTAVVRHRQAHKDAYAQKGVRLTFSAYFASAIVYALQQVPQINSRLTDDGILTHRRVHLGIAVSLDDGGLIVPVIRDADEMSLRGLARAINNLADRARSGKLSPDDLVGGTFTFTNHGVGGSLIGTPIINQPQSGILGAGAIVKRVVVQSATASLLPSADDVLAIRPISYLSFSFDHRLLDGSTADRFVATIKARLESWPELE